MEHTTKKTTWGRQDATASAKEQQDWYIAAPFFNEQQVIVVKQIENVLAETGRRCFTPRLSIPSVVVRKDGLTDELAKAIFDTNVEMLQARCNLMVAYFGWELPEDRAIFNVGLTEDKEYLPMRAVDPLSMMEGPLNIPDAGTVWEAGYAVCSAIPVFGIFGEDQRPNLMLTQSCAATFKDVESFKDWLEIFDSDPSTPMPKWKGPLQ